MNIFESLKHHYAGPQHEFEAVAAEIITFMQGATRVKPYPGDKGMDLYAADQNGHIETIWQIKYHPEQWTQAQKDTIKKDIRKAEELKPKIWVLVIPKDPTPKDIEWWEAERKNHQFTMELITGGKLELLLSKSGGIRGQAIQNKILGTSIKSAKVTVHCVTTTIPTKSNWALCLHLENTGNSSLEDVKVDIHHNETKMVVSGAPEQTWHYRSHTLNPWHLSLKETLHPNENIPIKRVEFREEPDEKEFFCKVKVTAKDMMALTFNLEKPIGATNLQISKDAEDFIKTWKPTSKYVHILRDCKVLGLGNIGFYTTETDHNYCENLPIYEASGVEEIIEELTNANLLKSKGTINGPDSVRELLQISTTLEQLISKTQQTADEPPTNLLSLSFPKPPILTNLP